MSAAVDDIRKRVVREYAKFFTRTFHDHGLAQTRIVAEAMIEAAAESLEYVSNPRHAYNFVQRQADQIVERNPPVLPERGGFR